MSEKQIRVGLIEASADTKAFHIPGLANKNAYRSSLSPTGRAEVSANGLQTNFALEKSTNIGRHF